MAPSGRKLILFFHFCWHFQNQSHSNPWEHPIHISRSQFSSPLIYSSEASMQMGNGSSSAIQDQIFWVPPLSSWGPNTRWSAHQPQVSEPHLHGHSSELLGSDSPKPFHSLLLLIEVVAASCLYYLVLTLLLLLAVPVLPLLHQFHIKSSLLKDFIWFVFPGWSLSAES